MNEAQIIALKESIDYSDDSVVSKTIMKKEVGNLTLFAFDQGQELSEHTSPFDAVVQVIDGVGTIIVAGKEHEITEGSMAIMPANIPHAVKANQRFKMLLIMIRSG